MQDWEPRALPSDERVKRWRESGGVWHFVTNTADGAFCMARVKARAEYTVSADLPVFRPWRDNNPAPWSDFYTVTHPPIPEGWEQTGHWFVVEKNTVLSAGNHWLSDDGTVSEGWPAKRPAYMVGLRRTFPAIPEGWEAASEWRRYSRDCITEYHNPQHDGVLTDTGRVFSLVEPAWPGMPACAKWYIFLRRVPPPADWGDVPKGVDLRPRVGDPEWLSVYSGEVEKRCVGFVILMHNGNWNSYNPATGVSNVRDSLPAAIVALTGRREKA